MPNDLALPAGSLRHAIEIQAPATSHDSFGQPLQVWNSVLHTRASIEVAGARETYAADRFSAQVTHTIRLRWPGPLPRIAGGMRVVSGSHTYQIQTVENVRQLNRVLQLQTLSLNGAE